MKKKILLSVLLLLLFAGCNMMSEQRVAMLENAVVQAEKISDDLKIQLDDMETTLTETQTALADPNLPAEFREQLSRLFARTIEGIKVVSAKRAEYAGLISKLRKQIEEAKKEGMNFGEELQLYGEGLQTTGGYLPPPVGGYVTLAGTVFGIFGTLLAKKRKKEFKGVVKSVDKLLESDAVPRVAAAMTVLKGNQSADLREAIRKVH